MRVSHVGSRPGISSLGGSNDPRELIQREGLTVDRYSRIEAWMASDASAWRALTREAVGSCMPAQKS